MRKFYLLPVVVLLLGLILAPAAAQDDMSLPDIFDRTECEVDLSGQEITIWHIGDLSGPYGFITQPLLAGLGDAANYFNERGGICGATITLPDPTTIDTGGDQNQTSTIYSRVSAEDPDIIILYSSDDAELLRTQVAEDEIPVVISAGSIEGLYGGEDEGYDAPGWIFATNPLYADQIGSFCEYAAENIDDPVLGYISWPSAFGRAAFTPETQAYCESVGVEVIDEPEYFAPGSDIRGQIQNLIDNGANILYTNSLATGPASIAATVNNMGLLDQVTLAGVNWVLDTSAGLLGAANFGPEGLPSINGMLGSLPFYWYTEQDVPGIAFINEQAELNERGLQTRNISYILGWLTVDLISEYYAVTLNRVGEDGLDGAAMKETIENHVYSPMGLIEVDFRGGEIRDLALNRIAEMRYLGENGGPAELPDNPPVVVTTEDGQNLLIPILVPLTDFQETPDLRPGQLDTMESEGE